MPVVDPDVVALEARREAASIPASAMLSRARVGVATHWAWLNQGAEPKRSTLKRCTEALDGLIKETSADG